MQNDAPAPSWAEMEKTAAWLAGAANAPKARDALAAARARGFGPEHFAGIELVEGVTVHFAKPSGERFAADCGRPGPSPEKEA